MSVNPQNDDENGARHEALVEGAVAFCRLWYGDDTYDYWQYEVAVEQIAEALAALGAVDLSTLPNWEEPPPRTEIHALSEIPDFATEADEASFWSAHTLGDELLAGFGPPFLGLLPPPRTRNRQ